MKYIDPSNKVLNHLDHITALRNGDYMPPVNVEIDLSNRCSLGCEWCHFAHTHTRGPLANKTQKPAGHIDGGDLMHCELAKSIISQLYADRVKSVTWTGGGEPTLHPDFDEIIQYTGRKLAQGIYTNGCHISPIRASIMKQNMKWVYISLDECTPEDYKASKGVDKFWQALDGIRHLVNAKGAATVGVGFMLHAGNYAKIEDMRHLAINELCADYVQFRPTVRYEQDLPSIFVDDADWLDNAIVLLSDMQDDPRVYADLERFKLYRDWNGHGYKSCYFSAMQTVITPSGLVWDCVNKREHPNAVLGDLSKETFRAIWERKTSTAVNGDCRLMCRGHMANITLDTMMKPQAHREFV